MAATTTRRGNGFSMERISVPKASSVLAEHLREGILTGQLQAGTMLPTERALAEQAGLGRTSVREALRMLEVEGLVATRAGRNGGSVAQVPSRAALEKAIHLFIRGQRVRFTSMLEVRGAVEPTCARLAAQRRTAEELAALEDIHAGMDPASGDIPAFLERNLAWHMAVVSTSHNELMTGFVAAIRTAWLSSTDIEGFNSLPVRVAVLRAHERVMEAIRAGDGEAAERRMRRHLHAYAGEVAREKPDMVDAAPVRRTTTTRSRVTRPSTTGRKPKDEQSPS